MNLEDVLKVKQCLIYKQVSCWTCCHFSHSSQCCLTLNDERNRWEKHCTDRPCSEYKWRQNNDAIVIKLTAGTQNKIPYKTYISDFSYFSTKNDAVFYGTSLIRLLCQLSVPYWTVVLQTVFTGSTTGLVSLAWFPYCCFYFLKLIFHHTIGVLCYNFCAENIADVLVILCFRYCRGKIEEEKSEKEVEPGRWGKTKTWSCEYNCIP